MASFPAAIHGGASDGHTVDAPSHGYKEGAEPHMPPSSYAKEYYAASRVRVATGECMTKREMAGAQLERESKLQSMAEGEQGTQRLSTPK